MRGGDHAELEALYHCRKADMPLEGVREREGCQGEIHLRRVHADQQGALAERLLEDELLDGVDQDVPVAR